MTEQQAEVTILRGPIVTTAAHSGIIYSITLANGHIVTSPEGFGEQEAAVITPQPVPLPKR